MQMFRNIVVMPTQGLRNGIARPERRLRRGIFRGGPIWPLFALQVSARHCRGLVPFPCDVRPSAPSGPVDEVAEGVWCGPVSPHFGHMIADFSMRIARAAAACPDLPLVFSAWPDASEALPAFFWNLLALLGATRDRIVLIRRPTRFGILRVPPQAERLLGKGPDARHLDLMDSLAAARGPVPRDVEHLFVSRSGLPDGRLAGEGYLDEVFRSAGASVIHPEALDLDQQVDAYRRARRLIFTEGSALHGLQLLGRVPADAVVLLRRPWARTGAASLRPRLLSLRYLDITAGSVHGLDRRGRPHLDRALRFVDDAKAAALLGRLGLDPRLWDGEQYRRARDADIRRWTAYLAALDLHPGTLATVRACLARHGVAVDADAAWTTPFA